MHIWSPRSSESLNSNRTPCFDQFRAVHLERGVESAWKDPTRPETRHGETVRKSRQMAPLGWTPHLRCGVSVGWPRYCVPMTLFLSHDTAMTFWQHCPTLREELQVVPGAFGNEASSHIPDPERVSGIPLMEEAGLIPPFHVVVPDQRMRLSSRFVRPHCLKASVPRGSFLRIASDVAIASPELCFFEMATRLSLPRAVRFGMQLSGTFSLEAGTERRRDWPQLTSKRRLERFVRMMRGSYGCARATRAVRWVLDGSASPMESNLAMLLCLPKGLGGYGVCEPQLNRRIEVTTRDARVADKRHYVCDLFWPSAHLDVEYDSDEFHTGQSRIASDSARRAALDYMGISVVTITRRQLEDAYEFNRVMRLIARKLGQRLDTSASGEVMSKKLDLRRDLFTRYRS